jgi:hypothetical protein
MNSILCAKDETTEFHKRGCIMGDYLRCKIELLDIYPHELTTERHTQCHNIGHEMVGKSANGQDKKISKVIYNDTTPLELIQYLKPRLSKFVVHNFIVC